MKTKLRGRISLRGVFLSGKGDRKRTQLAASFVEVNSENVRFYSIAFFGVRGKGRMSRMLAMPVMYMIIRSKPRPNPA